ncbi:hypothetical protein ACQBAU_10055 [Propionibacteriaceae bacterium Y2011]
MRHRAAGQLPAVAVAGEPPGWRGDHEARQDQLDVGPVVSMRPAKNLDSHVP